MLAEIRSATTELRELQKQFLAQCPQAGVPKSPELPRERNTTVPPSGSATSRPENASAARPSKVPARVPAPSDPVPNGGSTNQAVAESAKAPARKRTAAGPRDQSQAKRARESLPICPACGTSEYSSIRLCAKHATCPLHTTGTRMLAACLRHVREHRCWPSTLSILPQALEERGTISPCPYCSRSKARAYIDSADFPQGRTGADLVRAFHRFEALGERTSLGVRGPKTSWILHKRENMGVDREEDRAPACESSGDDATPSLASESYDLADVA